MFGGDRPRSGGWDAMSKKIRSATLVLFSVSDPQIGVIYIKSKTLVWMVDVGSLSLEKNVL